MINPIPKRLILIGGCGHGMVCADIAELTGFYDTIRFLDDNTELMECAGYPVVGTVDDYVQYIDMNTEFFVSIGNCAIRKRIYEQICLSGARITTLIHPESIVSKGAKIGKGSVIMAGTVINPGVEIGKGCIVNTSSSIDHECRIGDFCHISVGAHLSGMVVVGDVSWIGAGAIINNNIDICSNCMIGAGTVVVKSIREKGTYVGVPAKRIK